ncbi:oxidoreductase [Aeromicrobium phragmitis]|uniref:Oxidoreductase n=1 Tax=Aeromicrobium phragmitis TaxID=2478914 RepID=A0A3L8PMD5_9ACTN|nr:Gfo/Idh/MocA family oxidoreductase [Aeromicrobium phragmitis]RLV55182.1 oxidoreductase [Aeromicrobium phragmitis]
MKIGLIGAGRIGVMHARHLVDLPRVEEVVVFDERPGAAAAVAADLPNVRVAGSLDETLARADGVVIAASTDAHPALVRAALAAGVPALCEKPIAADLETMQGLVDEIDATATPVVVGFQRRFDPAMRRLKSLLDEGAVGSVLVVRATGCDAVPPDPAYIATSGGIFKDMLIHDLDAIPWLVGDDVVEVFAQGSVLIDESFARSDDVDVATATLRFASGALAQLVGTRFNPIGYDHRVEVLGTRDSLAVGLHDHDHTPLAHLSAEGRTVGPAPYPGFPERFRAAYVAEMTTFTEVVAGEAVNPSPARESLVSLRLAEACEQSRRAGGRPVPVAAPVAH